MNGHTTLRLLVLVLLLGLGITLSEYRRRQPGHTNGRPRTTLLDLPGDRVHTVTITLGSTNLVCRRDGDGWRLAEPLRWHADRAAVERLLAAMEAMPVANAIKADERQLRGLELSDYGLVSGQICVQLRSAAETINVLFGLRAPLSKNVYVKRADDDHVYATPATILDALPSGLDDLRDRNVFHDSVERVTRMELHSKQSGFIRVVRQKTAWKLEQPCETLADHKQAEQLLNALFRLRITNFYWDPRTVGADSAVEAMARAETCGLTEDRSVARLTIWINGHEVGQSLIIGETTGDDKQHVYARTGETESIFLLPADILHILSLQADDLRDRHLIPHTHPVPHALLLESGEHRAAFQYNPRSGWQMSEPDQGHADQARIAELLSTLSTMEATDFIDTLPTNTVTDKTSSMDITLSYVNADETNRMDTLKTRLSIDRAATRATAQVEGVAGYMEIPYQPAHDLVSQSLSPAAFRDRTVLALEPENVRDLSVTLNGTNQLARRNEKGAWVADDKHIVQPKVIDDTLFLLANLRAARIEAIEPKTLEPYGLHQRVQLLSIGLQNTEGIRKHILFGTATPGGRYLTVQGSGVVFVVPETVARRLLQFPAVPAAPTAQ